MRPHITLFALGGTQHLIMSMIAHILTQVTTHNFVTDLPMR